MRWAAALLEGLSKAGVERAVLSPGSRSTPLIVACDNHLQTQVMVDERSAAFYALGLAKSSLRPVVLVCTSGTAAANWYPAVVEASYSQIPLILLTADRPPEILGFGANQTIDQVKLFGSFVRAYHGLPPAEYTALASLGAIAIRAVEQSLWPSPGPVHINVPFREPFIPYGELVLAAPGHEVHAAITVKPVLRPNPENLGKLAEHLTGRPGFIICGELPYDKGLAKAITKLAAALDCPILADPLSNLRRGAHDRSHILCHYDAWLGKPNLTEWWGPHWIIRFGTTPVSKRLHKILTSIKPPLSVIVDAYDNWHDPQHTATTMIRADVEIFCHELTSLLHMPKSGVWLQVLGPLENSAIQHLTSSAMPLEWAIIQDLLAELPAEATLFIGNSMPIRDLDSCLGSGSKTLRILANRGASGIDGTVSTLAGIAAVGTGTVVGVIGDLAMFHDLNALHVLRDLHVTLVVFNNGGGGIFRYMAQTRLPKFERHWLTPTKLDIARAAGLFGINHHQVMCRNTFTAALKLALSSSGANVIEVIVDAEASVTQHRAYWAAVAG